MTSTTLLTAEDLYALGPECCCELEDGRLAEMSPAGSEHGQVAILVGIVVGSFVLDHGLGTIYAAETGFVLGRDPDLVHAPVFAFVADGRVTPEMDISRYLELAPDLVVEVVSPNDTAAKVEKKVLEYLQAGVRLVLVAYPSLRAVAVHRPGRLRQMLPAGDELFGEDILPGFTYRVNDLFPKSVGELNRR
ncbi:MAG: Uma2 family endonuclease [Dehalococcoidia bacterium]